MTRYYVKKFVGRTAEKRTSRRGQEEKSEETIPETEKKLEAVETPSDEESVEKKDKSFKKKETIKTQKGE